MLYGLWGLLFLWANGHMMPRLGKDGTLDYHFFNTSSHTRSDWQPVCLVRAKEKNSMELEECLNILKCLRAKNVEFTVDDLKCEDEIEYIGEKEWFKGFGDIRPDMLIAPKNKADLYKFAEHYRKHGAKNLFPQTYASQKNYCLIVIWSDGKIICFKKIS